MLQTIPQPGPVLDSEHLFPFRLRVAETDEAGANSRGEEMVISSRQSKWHHWQVYCIAHKTHAAATFTWSLQQALISSIIAVLKTMETAGTMLQLKTAIDSIVEEHLQIYANNWHVPQDSVRLKGAALRLFQPSARHPRRRALVTEVSKMLNGDWTCEAELQH
eukprot:6208034-Amphidinium_carterae.1